MVYFPCPSVVELATSFVPMFRICTTALGMAPLEGLGTRAGNVPRNSWANQAMTYFELLDNGAKRHINSIVHALETQSQARHSRERIPIKRRMPKTRGLQRY